MTSEQKKNPVVDDGYRAVEAGDHDFYVLTNDSSVKVYLISIRRCEIILYETNSNKFFKFSKPTYIHLINNVYEDSEQDSDEASSRVLKCSRSDNVYVQRGRQLSKHSYYSSPIGLFHRDSPKTIFINDKFMFLKQGGSSLSASVFSLGSNGQHVFEDTLTQMSLGQAYRAFYTNKDLVPYACMHHLGLYTIKTEFVININPLKIHWEKVVLDQWEDEVIFYHDEKPFVYLDLNQLSSEHESSSKSFACKVAFSEQSDEFKNCGKFIFNEINGNLGFIFKDIAFLRNSILYLVAEDPIKINKNNNGGADHESISYQISEVTIVKRKTLKSILDFEKNSRLVIASSSENNHVMVLSDDKREGYYLDSQNCQSSLAKLHAEKKPAVKFHEEDYWIYKKESGLARTTHPADEAQEYILKCIKAQDTSSLKISNSVKWAYFFALVDMEAEKKIQDIVEDRVYKTFVFDNGSFYTFDPEKPQKLASVSRQDEDDASIEESDGKFLSLGDENYFFLFSKDYDSLVAMWKDDKLSASPSHAVYLSGTALSWTHTTCEDGKTIHILKNNQVFVTVECTMARESPRKPEEESKFVCRNQNRESKQPHLHLLPLCGDFEIRQSGTVLAHQGNDIAQTWKNKIYFMSGDSRIQHRSEDDIVDYRVLDVDFIEKQFHHEKMRYQDKFGAVSESENPRIFVVIFSEDNEEAYFVSAQSCNLNSIKFTLNRSAARVPPGEFSIQTSGSKLSEYVRPMGNTSSYVAKCALKPSKKFEFSVAEAHVDRKSMIEVASRSFIRSSARAGESGGLSLSHKKERTLIIDGKIYAHDASSPTKVSEIIKAHDESHGGGGGGGGTPDLTKIGNVDEYLIVGRQTGAVYVVTIGETVWFNTKYSLEVDSKTLKWGTLALRTTEEAVVVHVRSAHGTLEVRKAAAVEEEEKEAPSGQYEYWCAETEEIAAYDRPAMKCGDLEVQKSKNVIVLLQAHGGGTPLAIFSESKAYVLSEQHEVQALGKEDPGRVGFRTSNVEVYYDAPAPLSAGSITTLIVILAAALMVLMAAVYCVLKMCRHG